MKLNTNKHLLTQIWIRHGQRLQRSSTTSFL